MKLPRVGAAIALVAVASSAHAQGKSKGDMTFFVTSANGGNGANFGGLEGADKHCNELAKAAGSKHDNWRAYLSTTAPGGEAGVNARDRIGKGPWRNAKGVVVAKTVADLHSDKNNINKETALNEKGEAVNGRGDAVNTHDILTGSDPAGMYSTAGGDTTWGNWTKSAEGSAIGGHHHRKGPQGTPPMQSLDFAPRTAGCRPRTPPSPRRGGPAVCFCT